MDDRHGGEVRKTVTVLFCDITGSTSLGEQLDPESLRGVMSRFFEEMQAVLERHGGTVEKYIGDAVMAVFGIPAVHEDDALRAVRAAAEMRDALATLNKELERDRGVTIASRIGVNTGDVVAGDAAARQSLVTGDAVNVAARLEQAAGPGESPDRRADDEPGPRRRGGGAGRAAHSEGEDGDGSRVPSRRGRESRLRRRTPARHRDGRPCARTRRAH